jgi:saccharopine dehydrogenase-like NADP-dependent oxidoreductase
MTKKKVLIVGGYGIVGSIVSEILAKDENILLTIAGRNATKAEGLARKLNCGWRTIDLNDKESILLVLDDIDIVINCFGGPFTHFNLFLPELSLERGIHYLDVSGSYEYTDRFLKLNELAFNNQSILISALGVNPGIPGIVFMNGKDTFDELKSGKIYFILGSKMEGISVSSLKELKYMFDIKPLVWHKTQWVVPRQKGLKEYIGEPFEKDIYLAASLSRDLLALPKLTNVSDLSFWSGSQDAFQGLIMILGLKLGLTKRDGSAQFLMNLLKKIGKKKGNISDALIKLEMVGKRNGVNQKVIFGMYCDENYATAIAPAIVCKQIIDGKITKYGAFVPPEIVPAVDFVDRLKKFEINFLTTIEKI